MLRRMGRPGLIGTMARTAAITGTATAVNRSMTRRANARAEDKAAADAYYAQQAAPQQPPQQQPPPQQAPPAPAGGQDEMIAKLKQLGDMHTAGVLSDEEFAAAKAKLLS